MDKNDDGECNDLQGKDEAPGTHLNYSSGGLLFFFILLFENFKKFLYL